MPKKKKKEEPVEIKVKKVKDFDFTVPVQVEEKDEVGDLIYELSNLDPRTLKKIYKTARAFQRANRMTDEIREIYSDFSEE